MSRSAKKRLPWLVVTASPAPPTGLPETPMGRLPPLSCWMPAVRLRLRGPPARADDRRVRDPRARVHSRGHVYAWAVPRTDPRRSTLLSHQDLPPLAGAGP